jgi:nucleoid DNA-binding protein
MATAKTTTTAPRKTATTTASKAPAAPTEAPEASDAAPVISTIAEAAAHGPSLKKKEFLDRVLLASGGKKKDVRDIAEATLKVLGDALSKGEELVLPPLGRAKVNRSREVGEGEMIMVKLRRGGAKPAGGKDAKQALAEADD